MGLRPSQIIEQFIHNGLASCEAGPIRLPGARNTEMLERSLYMRRLVSSVAHCLFAVSIDLPLYSTPIRGSKLDAALSHGW